MPTPSHTARLLRGVVPLFALLVAGGCSSNRSALPVVRELYREAALREDRNPVIVIHGILGSRLEHQPTGRVAWGAFTKEGIDPNTPEGARMLAAELPGPGGALAYEPETAEVRPSGPLGAIEVGLFFGVLAVEVYAGILKALGVGGYTDPVGFDSALPAYSEQHFSCFTFFYDWRRDNVENAIAFGRYLERTRREVDAEAARYVSGLRALGTPAAMDEAQQVEAFFATDWKFDVVAHSMGGLIARYYLRYGIQDLPADGSDPEVTWAGAQQIDRMVLVGTPSLGAMDSLQRLVEGFELAFFLPHYHQAVLGMMPSIYQLLPRTDAGLVRNADGSVADVDVFDVATWDRNGWGLLDPESEEMLAWLHPDVADAAERRRRARAFVEGCLQRAKAFHRALDKDAERPCPTEILLFAADTIPTASVARLVPDGQGRLEPRFGESTSYLLGDETVPRYSALADRRYGRRDDKRASMGLDSPVPWSAVTFLPDDHVGITSNPVFINNLLFFLLEQPSRRSPQPEPVALFNGRDLAGWSEDIPAADGGAEVEPSFVVERGVLVSRGSPQGHLVTDASFRDYRLEVEYRWPGEPGNCGVLVHASTPRRLYAMFPQSIECQMHVGNAGDFWCIGEDIAVPDMEARRGPREKWGVDEGRNRRIRNLTDDSEAPLGEWNTMVIECRDRTITVWVNGDLVNVGSDCTADRGKIALQAEGARCEFRRVELTALR